MRRKLELSGDHRERNEGREADVMKWSQLVLPADIQNEAKGERDQRSKDQIWRVRYNELRPYGILNYRKEPSP